MLRRVAAICVAVLVVSQFSGWISAHVAPRHVDPLQATDSSAMYSQNSGQAVLYANLIVPRSDAIDGSTLIFAIGDESVLFTFDKKGNAKLKNASASIHLGAPTCQCPDGSHTAKLVVTVRGSKAKHSPLIQSGGSTPAVANVHLGFESESLEFDAPLMARK